MVTFLLKASITIAGVVVIISFLLGSQIHAKEILGKDSSQRSPVTLTSEDPYAEGYRLLSAQQYKAAERYWRGIYDSLQGQPKRQAAVLQQIAISQQSLGRLQIAKNSLHLAIKKLEHIDANPLLGSLYFQLATLQMHLNMLAEAKLNLQNAIRLINVDSNSRIKAVIQNKIGELYSLQNEPDQAIVHYIESFNEFLALEDKQGAMLAARNVIANAILLQRYKQATVIFTRAIKLAEVNSHSASLITAKIALLDVLNSFPYAEIERLSVKYVHAVLLLKQTLQTTGIGTFNEVYALAVLAELYYRAGQVEQALSVLNRVTFQSQQLGSNKFIVRSLMLLGKINRSQGKFDRSIQAYQLAVSHYARIRDQAFVPSNGAGNGDVARSNGNGIDEDILYLNLADLLLAKARLESNLAKKQKLLLQARHTIEQQKVTELQNYFNNTCDIPTSTASKSIDNVIGEGSAAIYPIILPDRIEILVTFSTGMQQFQTKENSLTVEAVVNEFRSNLENLNANAYLEQGQKIYRWIIAPIESELKRRGVETIIVVSEQMFRTIPLSVLHDGQQYLVEKYALAVVPGLQLIDPQPLDRGKLRVLLSGISDAVQGYPPLRYVQGELEEIQDLYVTKLLLNKEFVADNFERAMRDNEFSIAHLASHSEFKGNIRDSYILTFDGKMSMQRLSNITSLTRKHKQPIELLTLSSCQTAVGDDRAALGLAGVAIKAGARSALATLWSIDDFASSILVSEFYKQLLNQSISKAQALQRAQLSLIKSRRFDHPAYWSSFLLIGNWL